ncbi:MAG: T9SS type A sorting domain-containing protein [Cytophagaceae bacterium]|nr:T9SS type A sorting domain-containing protein [Cytophagaceae bacterium]
MQGRVRRHINQPGTMQELDLSYLPAGVYILVSQNEGKKTQFKIVKQ